MFDEWKPVACTCGTVPKVTDVYDGGTLAKVICPNCGRWESAYSDEVDRDAEDVVLEAISRWNSEIEEEKKNKGGRQ